MENRLIYGMGIVLVLLVSLTINSSEAQISRNIDLGGVTLDEAKVKDYVAGSVNSKTDEGLRSEDITINTKITKSFTITNPDLMQIEFEEDGNTRTLIITKGKAEVILK